MKKPPQDHDHKAVQDHLAGFATAFKSDTFDAKTLPTSKGATSHMAEWGAKRLARFLEAATPVLSAEQRTKLAESLREQGKHEDP